MINLKRIDARALWRAARSTTLTLAGMASIVTAAWIVHIVAGLLLLGISLLFIEYVCEAGDNK